MLDLEVECPQKPVHDIHRQERIAITFDVSDDSVPEVWALRANFPSVPHLNIRNVDTPKSLCLYEESWAEILPRWTPTRFIERTRQWLALTARGELHQDDQPIEPLLLPNSIRVIIPSEVFSNAESGKPINLGLFLAHDDPSRRTLLAKVRTPETTSGLKYVATVLIAKPQTHGMVRRSPATLQGLAAFLKAGEVDLIAELRSRLPELDKSQQVESGLAIIVATPMRRAKEGQVERWDSWVFVTRDSIRKIGIDIGLWDKQQPNGDAGLILFPDKIDPGAGIPVEVLAPHVSFSSAMAARVNGVDVFDGNIVSIGAGALGSQIVDGMSRSGFGKFTIVDDDDLLPHNLARHILPGFYVGWPKALALADYLNVTLEGQARGVVANALSPSSQGRLQELYSIADLLLDLSASATVARHLSIDAESKARRVSAFLNPVGTDLVVLAEDKERSLTLDVLEVQYYRALLHEQTLQGHLSAANSRLRYGRSCRDVSTIMSTSKMTMCAALAVDAIREVVTSDGPLIRVVRSDSKNGSVTTVDVKTSTSVQQSINGWTLILDQGLLSKLSDYRKQRLPLETGGVLIGHFDLARQRIYVVDMIPSPPDSEEWPTLYVRGCCGLLEQIQSIEQQTGGQLEYVGEWHSHPDNCPTEPSPDDITVFAWLTKHMAAAGLPALMAIVGEKDSSRWFLGEMLAAWEVRIEEGHHG
ncbi:MAG: Mov34/MPN/PAD-1 family protein [Planctomyces sp.]